MKPRPIYFMVDTSYQMHLGRMTMIDTPLAKVRVYLSQFCKRIDEQSLYMDRVKIYFADKLVQLELGKAESIIKEFTEDSNDDFKRVQKSRISFRDFWYNAIVNESPNAIFLLLTGYATPKPYENVDYFKRFNNVFVFDFVSEKMKGFDLKMHPSDDIFLKQLADKTHESFVDEYVTTVNFGLIFNGKFWSVDSNARQLSVNKIDVIASTNEKPLQHIRTRARDFLFPLPNCYTTDNGSPLTNANQYYALKQLLGEKSHWNDSLKIAKSESKTASPEEAKKLIAKAEPMEQTPTKPAKRAKVIKEESDNDDDDDEEYTPTKKTPRKSVRGRGGKRGARALRGVEISPSKPVTRSAGKRGRPKKVKEEEEAVSVVAEETPMETSVAEGEKVEEPVDESQKDESPKNEEPKSDESKDETMEEAQKEEVAKDEAAKDNVSGESAPNDEASKEETPKSEPPKPEEPKFSRFLVGRAVERVTNICRPVVLRLRGVFESDKFYHDSDKAKEATSDLSTDQPSPQIGVIPNTPQPVAEPFAPNVTMDEVELLEKNQENKIAKVEPATPNKKRALSESDEAPEAKRSKSEADETGAPTDFGQPESPVIDNDFDVPAEPNEEDLVSMQVVPIMSIPLTSEWEREQQLKTEALKAQHANDNTKYIEVIVLDLTWDEFVEMTGIVDDTDVVSALEEDEKTLVGVSQSNDYTKLAGWYSPVAMLFYVNKMLRALRKPNERQALFEQELKNMSDMVINGQNSELAFQFAYLFRSEAMETMGYLHPMSEYAANHFDQLGNKYYTPQKAPLQNYNRYHRGGEQHNAHHHHNWHRNKNNY